MQIETYLKKHQPILYQTFVNAVNKNQLSHAYLLSGNPGTPLLETAKFMAKSILCDDPSPLACNSCITCLRVDDDNYPDYFVFDGSKSTIKKDAVTTIESSFDKKAFEKKGIRIYILHLIENMTIDAINSILKFLEEPGQQIYAFLTTNNENNILPTIISRCQLLRLKLTDRKQVITSAIEAGIKPEDAEILSGFYNNEELIQEILNNESENNSYQIAKNAFVSLLKEFEEDDIKSIIYFTQTNVIPIVKTKESARFFIDMLAQGFEDLIAISKDNSPILTSYATMLEAIVNKLPNIEESLLEILKCRSQINTNVNLPLLFDHLIFTITKEI